MISFLPIFVALFLPLVAAIFDGNTTAPQSQLNSTYLKLLLQNAQQAQELNTQFLNLTLNDTCIEGRSACINRNLADCVHGAWETKKCLSSQECFALPSVNSSGTVVRCTSEASALSLMNATGVDGIFAPSNDSSDSQTGTYGGTYNSYSSSCSSSFPATRSVATRTASSMRYIMTSTIIRTSTTMLPSTFSLAASSVVVLPPVTTIIGVAQAQAAIASLIAGGNASLIIR